MPRRCASRLHASRLAAGTWLAEPRLRVLHVQQASVLALGRCSMLQMQAWWPREVRVFAAAVVETGVTATLVEAAMEPEEAPAALVAAGAVGGAGAANTAGAAAAGVAMLLDDTTE